MYRGIEIRAHRGFPNSSRRSKNYEYGYCLPRPAGEHEIALPEWQGANIKYIDGVAYTFKRKHTLWLDSTVAQIDIDLKTWENNGWTIFDASALQEVK